MLWNLSIDDYTYSYQIDVQPSHVRGKKIQFEVIPLAHFLL